MADEGISRGRKGKAQSTFWKRATKHFRQARHNGREKQNGQLAGLATLPRGLDDDLLQSIPESSFIEGNPYAEEIEEVYTAQEPEEDVVDILDVDSPDEQNNSILSEGYSQTRLITKAAKTLTIVFLFTAILVCATISKLCFVAITTQMNQALPLNFGTQPGITTINDSFSDAFLLNNMTDSGMDATDQPPNNTSDILEEQSPTPANGTSGEPQRQQQSIAFIQVVIVLMSPQLVTFVRMLFGGIIGKSSSTYPWPSIGAIVLVRLYRHTHACALTHVHILMRACAHTYTFMSCMQQ